MRRFVTRPVYLFALPLSFCSTVLPKFAGWIWRRYLATAAACNHLRHLELWPLPASTFLCFSSLRWLGSTARKCCIQQQVGVVGRRDKLGAPIMIWRHWCHNYWQDYFMFVTYTRIQKPSHHCKRRYFAILMLISRVLMTTGLGDEVY